MINRTTIRLKVVQLIYAYYQNGGKNIESAEKELLLSLSKAYELYNQLLMLIVKVTRYAAQQVEHQEELNRVTHKTESVSHRFIDNRFAAQLEMNQQLCEFREHGTIWDDETSYLKALYEDICRSEDYLSYMEADSVTWQDDRELWRKLYKLLIMNDERIDALLEEKSLYWNDDKEIVDTFVMKTIKRFTEESTAKQELLPEFKDEEDREFAVRLLRRSILNDEYYRSLINQNIQNWEFDRLAFMDVVIMQVAIAEILSFPQIPLSVSINEYVEIAKCYSTPKSYGYVNGILDAVTRRLKEDGKLLKE
ncbi:MAG: transcription antitermination factor NusB [Bacteroidaceae bacterium]|nr:transcription antitermination factor NusB [Bacteroidaceae bacterium]MDO4994624.1 transcription antitermination factor NusB [Bacteroidales bacterium]